MHHTLPLFQMQLIQIKEIYMLNKDILTMYEGLMQLAQNTDVVFPAKVSFAVARNIKAITPIVNDLEMSRLQVLNRYGTRENEDSFSVPLEKIDECNKELEALANMDIEVPLVKIKLSDLEDLKFSIAIAQAFEFMLEEET